MKIKEIIQENINKIKNQSLKTLIDLKLKENELKKFELEVNQLALNDHLSKISKTQQYWLRINNGQLQ